MDPKEIEIKNSASTKIHYSYYNRGENSKSIIDFVKEMRIKEKKKKEKSIWKILDRNFLIIGVKLITYGLSLMIWEKIVEY